MKLKSKNTLKILLFTVGLIFIYIVGIGILKTENNPVWNNRKFRDIYKNKNHYDVLFCGTSLAITNNSCQELYEKYGIVGYSIGYPQQPLYLTYYLLKEALQNQNPKVVMLDVKAAFYTEETLKEMINERQDGIAHFTIDAIHFGRNKYDAVMKTKEYCENLDIWEYFSPLYYNHGNWEKLKEDNFHAILAEGSINGNMEPYGMAPDFHRKKSVLEIENNGEKEELFKDNQEQLQKIIDLCKENKTHLILTNVGLDFKWNWSRYNTISEIAESNDIPYYDVNLLDEEIGIDHGTDTNDGNHMNLLGAIKMSDYFGEIFQKEYKAEDRRGEAGTDLLESQKSKYDIRVQAMKEKEALMRALNFERYMKAISNLDFERNTVLMAVQSDASTQFDDRDERLFKKLELGTLRNGFRSSYVAVIEAEGTKHIENENKVVELEGSLDEEHTYKISSGGKVSGHDAEILIDGEPAITVSRGLNVVVYSNVLGEVISSVSFDTYDKSNPTTGRTTDEGVLVHETDVNQWK